MAAIEVVGGRYTDMVGLGAPTLIADDFAGAGCVLGQAVPGFDPRRLDEVRAALRVDGQEVGAGVGSDVLGHPLDALAWLANSLAERGQVLKAGEIVLLGSLVQVHWVSGPCSVEIDNDLLGKVTAELH